MQRFEVVIATVMTVVYDGKVYVGNFNCKKVNDNLPLFGRIRAFQMPGQWRTMSREVGGQ